MSEPRPVSALGGASFEAPDVSIRELGAVGMVTLRGDLASKAFIDAVKATAGVAPPAQRRFSTTESGGLGWMSPDELLLLCDYADAADAAAAISAALAGQHHMALNVSDARTAFQIKGPGARELIAKGAPVDMSPAAFGAGDLRRSRLGQIAAAFWLGDKGDAGGFTLVCFRSVGAYAFDWLKASAVEGARPGLF